MLSAIDTSNGIRLLGVGVSGLSDYAQQDLLADLVNSADSTAPAEGSAGAVPVTGVEEGGDLARPPRSRSGWAIRSGCRARTSTMPSVVPAGCRAPGRGGSRSALRVRTPGRPDRDLRDHRPGAELCGTARLVRLFVEQFEVAQMQLAQPRQVRLAELEQQLSAEPGQPQSGDPAVPGVGGAVQ